MKQNNFLPLLKYEFLNVMGGLFTPLFGILMPVLMGLLFSVVIPLQVPEEAKAEAVTSIALSFITMIPMSIMLVSFPSTYAQEVEQNIISRLQLFQLSEKKILLVKILINYLVVTISLVVYITIIFTYNRAYIQLPHFSSVIVYLIAFYILTTIYFILSFSIANITKKFGATYSFAMVCYFMTMIFSGMMGIMPSQLPGALQTVSSYFPPSYIVEDFGNYWTTGFAGYNFAPFIQALIFWGALAGICFFISLYKNKSNLK